MKPDSLEELVYDLGKIPENLLRSIIISANPENVPLLQTVSSDIDEKLSNSSFYEYYMTTRVIPYIQHFISNEDDDKAMAYGYLLIGMLAPENYLILSLIQRNPYVLHRIFKGMVIGNRIELLKKTLTEYDSFPRFNLLKTAGESGNPQMITYLLDQFKSNLPKLIDPSVLDITLLEGLIKGNHLYMVKDLFDSLDLYQEPEEDYPDQPIFTILNDVGHYGNIDVIDYFLEKAPSGEDKFFVGFILFGAIELDRLEIVDYLLDRYPDADYADGLRVSIDDDNFEMVKLLLEKGQNSPNEIKEAIKKYPELEL